MQKILDELLLCSDVAEKFYYMFKNSKFNNWLIGVLPEIEDCIKCEQDNPWHIYGCLDHILHSVENINKLSFTMDNQTRKILAYTMFLHDMGKPKCKMKRYSKLYGKEIDSFFNHNIASEEIASRFLKELDFANIEKDIIQLLVKEHDIFMFITEEDDGNKFHKLLTIELVEEYINQYNRFGDGKRIFQMLCLVGLADNMAQNPKMTKASIHKINNIIKMIEKCDGCKEL